MSAILTMAKSYGGPDPALGLEYDTYVIGLSLKKHWDKEGSIGPQMVINN